MFLFYSYESEIETSKLFNWIVELLNYKLPRVNVENKSSTKTSIILFLIK